MDNKGDYRPVSTFVGDGDHSGEDIDDTKSKQELPLTDEATRLEPSDDSGPVSKEQRPLQMPSQCDEVSIPDLDANAALTTPHGRSSLPGLLDLHKSNQEKKRPASLDDIISSSRNAKRPRSNTDSVVSTTRPELGSRRNSGDSINSEASGDARRTKRVKVPSPLAMGESDHDRQKRIADEVVGVGDNFEGEDLFK